MGIIAMNILGFAWWVNYYEYSQQ